MKMIWLKILLAELLMLGVTIFVCAFIILSEPTGESSFKKYATGVVSALFFIVEHIIAGAVIFGPMIYDHYRKKKEILPSHDPSKKTKKAEA